MSMFKVLALCTIAIASVVSQNSDCSSKNTKNFDRVLIDYFLLASSKPNIPSNQAELKKFCKESAQTATKIKSFANKCFDKLLKRLTSLAVYSIQKTNSNMCRSKRKSAELIDMSKCGNAVNKANKKCWNSWMQSSNGIGALKDQKLRIPLVCCITYTMESCFSQNYENNKNCNQKSKDGLENLFGGYLTETLRLMCGEYTKDNDKCDKVITKLPKSNSTTGSPISLLLSIFDGIEEDAV